jgi:hypothetical protein
MESTITYIYLLNAAIVFVFLALFAFMLKEGAERLSDKIENAYITGNQSWLSHRAGWAIRFFLLAIIGVVGHHLKTSTYWELISLYMLLAWPGFNITINIFRKSKWYYVGKNGIDGLIRKCLPFINFDQ